MRRVGILGGMSWLSTLEYYRLMNSLVAQRLGGLHSMDMILHSCDFQSIADMQHRGDWIALGSVLGRTARELELAGAEFLIIATNTMHKLVPDIEQAVAIPILHIVDAAATAIKARHVEKVALLGTRFTMEDGFYTDRLTNRHGLSVLLPDESERQDIHRVLYRELGKGIVCEESRARYVEIIERLAEEGAQGVILGCTEIPLLIGQEQVSVPVFDTTQIHAEAAVDYAIR